MPLLYTQRQINRRKVSAYTITFLFHSLWMLITNMFSLVMNVSTVIYLQNTLIILSV